MITRAVGTEPSVEVETLTLAAAPGDLYLICSDGLTDIVRDEQIAELIAGGRQRSRRGRGGARRRRERCRRDRQHHGRRSSRSSRATPRAEPTAPPRASPTADTVEQAAAAIAAGSRVVAGRVPVRRHGAGAGGRWLALLAIVADARGRRARRLVEHRPVSARNKELLNLGFAAIVASAASRASRSSAPVSSRRAGSATSASSSASTSSRTSSRASRFRTPTRRCSRSSGC